MIEDPAAAQDGSWPYAALAEAGITLSSSQAEIRNAPFELMLGGVFDQRAQTAADRLRNPRWRLLADAFAYDVDLAAELTAERDRFEREYAETKDVVDPPDVVALALRVSDEWLLGQLDDFDEFTLDPPPAVLDLHGLSIPPAIGPIVDLIRFDREEPQ
jgi:hypothetical protein